MSREELHSSPPEYNHFPGEKYVFYNLYNEDGSYGVGAVAELPDALEVHIELFRWGPKVARSVMDDAAWLRGMAASLGKARVVGVKQEEGEPDPRWPKFTKLLGFRNHALMQTAVMDPEPYEPETCKKPGSGLAGG